MRNLIYQKERKSIYLVQLLSLFLCLFAHSISAQTYPVQTNVHLVAPYSKQLNDYYTTSSEKLIVTLLNKDQLKPTLEVRLRMTIMAGNGLKIQSNENVNYPTISLDAGIPTRLTQSDLAPYFENILTSGYFDKGKLPDGQVEFTFQVVEKYTNKILSNPATARAWLTTQKPPLLRLPSNDEWVSYSEHMHLKFQWTPQHKNLSQIEYEFELRELPDYGAAPQSTFLYAPIIHQERLLYTNLMYDVMMPPLESNKLYGWRVRAIAKDGVDDLNLFENNGYSEIFWFRTGDNCPPPIGVNTNLDGRKLNLTWIADLANNEFVVQYRPKYGTSNEDWKELRSYEPQATIYDISRGITYEYRVGAICTSGQPFYSVVGEISVPKVDSVRALNCGMEPQLNLENQERLPELKTGDVVHLSDYPMTVTRVSGANGNFTGEGWVPVNWLLETKWAVEFSNIVVNTDYKLIGGSVRAKYDENEGNIANIDHITEGGTDNTRNGITRVDVTLNIVIPPNPTFTYNEETGEVLVFDTSGGKQIVELPKGNDGKVVFPVTVKDKNGDIHKIDVPRDENGNPIVDEKGKPKTDKDGNTILESSHLGNQGTPLSEDNFDPKNISPSVAIITFSKGDGKYAFDAWSDEYKKISKIKEKYEFLANGGKDYHIPWKLLPAGTSDIVSATIKISNDFRKVNKLESKDFDPLKVIFTTKQGVKFKADYDSKGESYKISLLSGMENDEQEIYALYPKAGSTEQFYTIGKLNVITYKKQEHKVVIVPVNGKDIDEVKLKQYLNEVYGAVGVTWAVEKDAKFEYAGTTKDFFKEGSKLLSAYNQNMLDLQNTYKQIREVEKDACYLFIMDKSGSEAGFMPRGKQFGYIFTDQRNYGTGDVYHTIAHELGHGCWSLSHTFDRTYGEVLGEKETDNLMSYSGGTHLAKWQWDVMDQPAWFTNPLDGDDKGMAIAIHGKIPDNFANSDGSYTFITPSGEYLNLPNEIYNVIFHHGISSWGIFENITTGTLVQFSYKGSVFHYKLDKTNGTFSGYVKEDDPSYSWSNYTSEIKTNPEGYILGLPSKSGYKLYRFTPQNLNKYNGDSRPILAEDEFPLDIFNTSTIDLLSKYEYNDLVTGNNQYQISEDEIKYLSVYEETPSHLLVSKIAQIKSMYPDIFANFCTQFNEWNSTINIISGHWDKKVRDDEDLIRIWKENPKLFYSQMLQELKEFCQNEREKTDLSLKELCNNFSEDYSTYRKSPQIEVYRDVALRTKNKIATLLLGSLSLDEIVAMPIDLRKELLSILTTLDINDDCEKAIIKLIYNVKESEVDALFDLLKEPNLFEPRGVVLNSLIKGVDDAILGFWGGDNFKEFNKAIIYLSSKSPIFKQKVNERNLFLVTHGYSSIFKRTLETLGRADDYPIGTTRMDVDLTDKGQLQVKLKEVTERKTTHVGGAASPSTVGAIPNFETSASVWKDKDPLILDPFEPVVYVKDNELGMLSDWKEGEEYTVPALFLHYADTKAGNKTISDASMAAIDLLGLATGYGELKMGVTGIRKFWAVADLINSGVNLAANVSDLDNDPSVKPFLDFYNLATVASNVTRIVSNRNAKTVLKEIDELQLDKVEVNFPMKLEEFSSSSFNIDNFTEDQLIVFKRHFENLHQEAAARGGLAEIESGTSSALAKINKRLGQLDVDLSHSLISDLIDAGLRVDTKGQTTRLLNHKGETVATIFENKFTPTKWKAADIAQNQGYTEIILDNGYVLYKKGNDIAFDIGFQNGRVLSADEINNYLQQSSARVHLFGQPYKSGTNALEMELKSGTTLYIVEEAGKGAPGQFFTDKRISSVEELRQWLAVKEEWKSGELVVKAYKVKDGVNFQVRAGVIGMQTDGLSQLQDAGKVGTILEGGGYQYQSYIFLTKDNWKKYLDPIETFELK